MKCINKKKRKPMTLKQQAAYRKRLKRTGILTCILLFFLLIGTLILFFLSRQNSLDDAFAYDRSTRTFGTVAKESLLLEEGMSGDLCVGSDNTSLEGITPAEGECGGLFDLKAKEIPYAQGLHEKLSSGEFTKLMTALTAYENASEDTVITVEESDVIWGGGSYACGLSTGDQITVRQLLNAVLISSSEDACLALARSIGGSQEGFVSLMNQKAQALGMTNTRYLNSTGDFAEGQTTTVYDTYLLLNAVLTYPDLVNSMGLSSTTLTYTGADGKSRQKWLDTKDFYVTGLVSVPKGITVLGGKYGSTDSQYYGAMLLQDLYGDVYVSVVSGLSGETILYERFQQMLEKISS